MKTLREVQEKVGGVIRPTFSYAINKDRNFYMLVLSNEPTIDMWNTLDANGYYVRKNIHHRKANDNTLIGDIVWEVQHRNQDDVEYVD